MTADQLLGNHRGAIILMNAETGEILVMASHPEYDPNNLDEEGDTLSQAETSPLLLTAPHKECIQLEMYFNH